MKVIEFKSRSLVFMIWKCRQAKLAADLMLSVKNWLGRWISVQVGSFLSEITVGQEVAEFVSKMTEAIELRDYEKINPMNCTVDILKRNNVKIETGVDSVEVWEFVHLVENRSE
jgi:hypothetical protein